MSIQYAGGTIINSLFIQTAGTRAELTDWIQGRLVAAGWSSVTNAASDYDLTSATTPQSLSARVRIYDPGISNNCMRLKLKNANASKVQVGDCFLLPAIAKTWQIIANKYQYFVFTPGVALGRSFACGGALYVPSFNGVTEGIWGGGDSRSDTTNTAQSQFRSFLGWGRYNSSAQTDNCIGIVNGTITESNAAGVGNVGGYPCLLTNAFGNSMTSTSPTGGYLTRWFNNSYIVTEPLMAWGSAGGNEPKVIGQIWDGIVMVDTLGTDTIISFDGHTFQAITNSNLGSVQQFQPGQFFVAIT